LIHFNTDSWHYRLVLYVFGKNFFIEKDGFDFAAMDKLFGPNLPTDYHKIIYKTKPKVVNFCPYCRGVLWSALSLPFVYVWRIFFPYDPTKVRTHAEIMKRMKIRGILIRSIGGSIQFPFGIMSYLNGNYEAAIINFVIGFLIIATFLFLPGHKRTQKILGTPFICIWLLIKPIVNFIGKYFEKKEEKKIQKNLPKNPSIVVTYLQSKHHALCPPVCFIDKYDQENLR